MKVSIITVCFNSEKYIGDCIDSVNNQSYTNIEHIFIDGNSQDNTTDLIVSRSKRNTILISERDEGIYDAMNKGLQIATGEVIGFLNSDDLFNTEFVVNQLVNAFESSDIDALWGDLNYVYPSDTQNILREWRSRQLFPADLKKGFIPPHPSFYIKKSALLFLKSFNTRYSLASDFDFMKRAILCPNIKTNHLSYVVVRMRAGGATSNGISNIIKQNIEIIHSLKMSFQEFSYTSFVFHKIANKLQELISAIWNRHFSSY